MWLKCPSCLNYPFACKSVGKMWNHLENHFKNIDQCVLCYFLNAVDKYHSENDFDWPDRLGCQCFVCYGAVPVFHECTNSTVLISPHVKHFNKNNQLESIALGKKISV